MLVGIVLFVIFIIELLFELMGSDIELRMFNFMFVDVFVFLSV